MSERRGKWTTGGVACSGRPYARGDPEPAERVCSPAKMMAGGKSKLHCLQCSHLAEGTGANGIFMESKLDLISGQPTASRQPRAGRKYSSILCVLPHLYTHSSQCLIHGFLLTEPVSIPDPSGKPCLVSAPPVYPVLIAMGWPPRSKSAPSPLTTHTHTHSVRVLPLLQS